MIHLHEFFWGVPGRCLGGPLNRCWDGGTVLIRGANGCGKTTLLRTLVGLAPSWSGRVTVLGHDPRPDGSLARRGLGWLPDRPPVPPRTTVREMLDLVRWAKGAPWRHSWSTRLDLEPLLDQAMGSCSLGEQRRVCLAAALVGDPPVLVLDEPDRGLDMARIELLYSLLSERAATGRLTVIATHHAGLLTLGNCDTLNLTLQIPKGD